MQLVRKPQRFFKRFRKLFRKLPQELKLMIWEWYLEGVKSRMPKDLYVPWRARYPRATGAMTVYNPPTEPVINYREIINNSFMVPLSYREIMESQE